MDEITLGPFSSCTKTLEVPGSKSISNRALLLGALCKGNTLFSGLLEADDVNHMKAALTQLGIYGEQTPHGYCLTGGGPSFTKTEKASLDLGNAGTAMRPLLAVLALAPHNGVFQLTGEPRMYERPIGPLVESLKQLKAEITYLGAQDYPPLEVCHSKDLSSLEVLSIDGSLSSQYVSALLLALPLRQQTSYLNLIGTIVSRPYIELTRHIMADFGVEVTWQDTHTLKIPNTYYKSPGTYRIEPDASSASYFLAAAAITGGPVTVLGMNKNSLQGDIAFADALVAMGADATFDSQGLTIKRHKPLKGIEIDCNAIPDAAMSLAIVALFAQGRTVLKNIYNWRIKETDRLKAMATELRKLGVQAEEGHDYLIIEPTSQLKHATIKTYNDHRMAMCFALASFNSQGITIQDPQCCSKTYPRFFEDFLACVS